MCVRSEHVHAQDDADEEHLSRVLVPQNGRDETEKEASSESNELKVVAVWSIAKEEEPSCSRQQSIRKENATHPETAKHFERPLRST